MASDSVPSVPNHIALMRPTLMALKALGGSGSNAEIYDKLIEIEAIPEAVQNYIGTGYDKPLLAYKAGWARSYLKMVGALTNSGTGIWALTPEGETLSDEEIQRRVKQRLKEGHEVRKAKRQAKQAQAAENAARRQSLANPVEAEAEEEGEHESSELHWREELLEVLYTIHPSAFERLSQRLLRESGFTKVEVTGKTGDGGIDGIGVLRINLLSFTVFFQCKRYRGSVGSGAIRDFRGAMMGRADKGLVITTGSFTADARKEATRDGATAIDLIDGEDLADLLKKHQLGLQTELIEKVTVEADFFRQI